jgi:hypothetical protein
MAGAQGRLPDGTGKANATDDGTAQDTAGGTPPAFRAAVAGLRAGRPRPGVALDPVPPPRRLAPYAYALQAGVRDDSGDHHDDPDAEELADGRLVLLHDPAGAAGWHGTFRLVTLVSAALEPEMAADPLLPEVCWSWLTGALGARGLEHGEPSGTVTRAGSHHFGGLAERPPSCRIEIRASWTPQEAADGAPDTAAHLEAWCDLLCQVAGLPPAVPGDASVVSLPQRRGPRRP